MRRRIKLYLLCCWLLLVHTARAQSVLVLPHIAVGGQMRTEVLLFNTSATDEAKIALEFFAGDGTPLRVNVNGSGETSALDLTLSPAAARKLLLSDDAAALRSGWGRISHVSAKSIIGAQAIFQLFSSGALTSQAAVAATSTRNMAQFTVDSGDGAATGFAVVNPNPFQITISLTLRNEDGALAGQSQLSLEPLGHLAKFVDELFPPGCPLGTLTLTSPSDFAAIALRFDRSGRLFTTLAMPPPENEVFFSPAGGAQDRIVRAIDSARSTIDIAMFTITVRRIASALLGARDRGVKVRVISDLGQSMDPSSQVPFLRQSGIETKIISGLDRGVMHNKFAIFDGKMLLTGSYNWSVSAESFNFENALFTLDPQTVLKYKAEFEKLWGN